MMPSSVEREIKFRLPAGRSPEQVREAIASAGFAVVRTRSVSHVDRYLDTDDWLLYRAGVALRIRERGENRQLEAKTVRSASESVLVRSEWSQEAPPGEPPWPEIPDGAVASLLRPLSALGATERLGVRVQIRNERELYRWSRGETLVGAVSVDQVAADGLEPFQEMEVELAEEPGGAMSNGAGEALAAVCEAVEERLGIKPSLETKLSAALGASGRCLPERDERTFALHPADRLVDVAHKTIGRHLGRLLWNEPGTRLGVDPDFLHDMRVASRRLRTALDVFAEAIPEEIRERLGRDLRWVGRALGRVRDLDVAIHRVGELMAEASDLERPALEIFRQALEIRLARRRIRLLERLDSERYATLAAEARAWPDVDPPAPESVPAGGVPAYQIGPHLIAERVQTMRERYEEAENDPTPEALHALRIAAKRARYAVEYLADLEGLSAHKRAKRLARLQDFLGERQDAVTLLRRMRRYARTIPRGDRELMLSAGSALGVLERATRTRRSELRKAWEEAGEA